MEPGQTLILATPSDLTHKLFPLISSTSYPLCFLSVIHIHVAL